MSILDITKTKLFFECDDYLWHTGAIHLPKGVMHYSGSDWMALNGEFLTYIIHENDDLVKGLKKFFTYMANPCEAFFHTILRNSRFCSTVVNNNLHLINWNKKIGCNCKVKHPVDYCGCSPNGTHNLNIYFRLIIIRQFYHYS